jgi:Lon protease-like protein
MINDSMKMDKLIGMIQPLGLNNNKELNPKLHKIGCLGKITSFKKSKNDSFLIELQGLARFETINEIKSDKKYRQYKINFDKFDNDLKDQSEEIKFTDLELIFKDLKSLFEKRGFIINWKALEKQSLNETINALAMASPFSLEEKQVLLEAKTIDLRKNKIAEILRTYSHDIFENTTLQ